MFDKTVNLWETNLALLKKGGTIKKNFKFEDHKFYVTVYLNMPIGSEENKNLEEIKIIDVAYTPPPFKSASGGPPKVAQEVSVGKSTGGRKKTVKKVENVGEVKEPGEVKVPQGVGKDEIEDPDVQRNLWSCYYCKVMSEKYDKMVKSYLSKKKPCPPEIQAKMLLFQSQMMSIQSAIENEQVSFDQYMEFLNKGVTHDKILLGYFQDIGDTGKASQVKFRIECFEKEINGEVEEEDEEEEDDE